MLRFIHSVRFSVILYGSLILLLGAVCFPSHTWGQSEKLLIRGGVVWHNIFLTDGYGKFIKDRYGPQALTLTGTTLSGAYKFSPTAAVGFEIESLSGSFTYKTLNDEKQTNKLNLEQQIIFLSFFPPKLQSFELGVGFGSNALTRDFYGYQDAEILHTNIENNQGTATSRTTGTLTALQAFYHIFGEKIGVDVGVRYTISKHSISSTDKRPGYNEQGGPTTMDFDVGGLSYLAAATAKF